jgi:low temperature requirement protein LtrA
MAERHGLFVIIALGESLIVAGTAITESAVTLDLVLVVGAVVVVAGLLWWTYFGWLADALEHQFARTTPERLGPVARDAFSLAHFPLITGVVAFAVAVEAIVAHPDHVIDEAVQAALAAGVTLFVASSALALRRVGGPLLRFRLVVLAITVGALAALVSLPPLPILSLGIIATSLLVIVVRESVGSGTRVQAG